jgi:hypothetical protein
MAQRGIGAVKKNDYLLLEFWRRSFLAKPSQ